MNHKIKEFVRQCEYDDEMPRNFDAERFAELIIEECIACCILVGGGALLCQEEIKTHFGVK